MWLCLIPILTSSIICLYLLVGGETMENAWWISIVVALIGLLGVLLSIWLQGRKDSVRIKDIDDKTMKVEPTKENTEKILQKMEYGDLRKITEYVHEQQTLQRQSKTNEFDYNQFMKMLEGLIKEKEELRYQNQELQTLVSELKEEIDGMRAEINQERNHGIDL